MVDRVILIVLDSVGIGEAPDAKDYGDIGSDTLGHLYARIPGFRLPNFERIGLHALLQVKPDLSGSLERIESTGAYGRLQEISNGKDTMTGHWELLGIHMTTPLDTYPQGFPVDWIVALEKHTGRGVIGNCVASGTAILDELGPEQMRTGKWIVYTSADSVFQIAAHEEMIPLDELYEACRFMREYTLATPQSVGRIIARPYKGVAGAFERTSNRHDYAMVPPKRTALNELKDAGLDVLAVGKINDIFSGQGITATWSSKDNADGMRLTLERVRESFRGLLFTNLVDFDAKYGHRRDAQGYARALTQFDEWLPSLQAEMTERDLLIITADHGNDPYHPGTDHTREYVPLLVWNKQLIGSIDLGVRGTFADIAATISDVFGLKKPDIGDSFYRIIVEQIN